MGLIALDNLLLGGYKLFQHPLHSMDLFSFSLPWIISCWEATRSHITTIIVPPRKQMSTSSRVTMTLLNHHSPKYKTCSFAGSKNSARFEKLAEAQLEAVHESLETMDFGDEVIDNSRDQFAKDEPVGSPLLSEFFKTCSQEQEPHHANAVWKEQMPILVNGYLAWRHGAPTIDDNTMVSIIFHVDVIGIFVLQDRQSLRDYHDEPETLVWSTQSTYNFTFTLQIANAPLPI
ncbi:hypothetical protein BDR04DRAFT_1118075 [Suillus decipiens]|nr:hypothetical protein BDR04DRAFT_1118075 [Suillus decipiens]